jgi:hypothetical protein
MIKIEDTSKLIRALIREEADVRRIYQGGSFVRSKVDAQLTDVRIPFVGEQPERLDATLTSEGMVDKEVQTIKELLESEGLSIKGG